MFSVDNFYSFMQSRYGWDRRNLILYKHRNNGSKDLFDMISYHNWEDSEINPYVSADYGAIVLHDQEPFTKEYINTYRQGLIARTKNHQWQDMSDQEILLSALFRHNAWPIFCHSEKDSEDIEYLKSLGFIDCHYFWHGLISRDWFRHWKHHPDLVHSNCSWKQKFLLYARDHSGSRQYRADLVANLQDIKTQVLYNWQNDKQISSDFSAKINTQDALDTAIHIVAETVFDQNKVHLTEKVFKPIVMRQPFIIAAGKGTLAYLREYGFKTFSEVWDESYDLEQDHARRLDMISKLVHDLYQLDDKSFNNMLARCESIIEHNRRHFYGQEFEDIMLAELDTNMENAILQQSRLREGDSGDSFFYIVDGLLKKQTQLSPGTVMHLQHMRDRMESKRLKKLEKLYPWYKKF